MFFNKRNQAEPRAEARPAAASSASSAVPALPLPASLPVDELRHSVDPAKLGFKTTAELEPISGLIGQDRALKAIQFGANIRSYDFNVFVLGPAASGKSTAVKQYLEK